MTRRERQHVAVLERRAAHLQERVIRETTRVLSYDYRELAALRWALRQLALAEQASCGEVA